MTKRIFKWTLAAFRNLRRVKSVRIPSEEFSSQSSTKLCTNLLRSFSDISIQLLVSKTANLSDMHSVFSQSVSISCWNLSMQSRIELYLSYSVFSGSFVAPLSGIIFFMAVLHISTEYRSIFECLLQIAVLHKQGHLFCLLSLDL